MYNAGKIITGIVIFVAIFTLPFWWQLGRAADKPKPELPKNQKQCVLDTEYMRTSHMQLLDQWRNSVVRDNNRLFLGKDGRVYNMSLTNECFRCHQSKTKFCDQCHNYLAVSPYCWECHLTPEQVKESK